MFDGSTKEKRQVSLRGKSNRVESRSQALEKMRKEREKRAREKLLQDSARKVQRVTKSFLSRQESKMHFR